MSRGFVCSSALANRLRGCAGDCVAAPPGLALEVWSGQLGLALLKFYGRDRPLPTVALNGDSQTVKLVKPNFFHGPGLSISEDYSLADDLRLGLLERTENAGIADRMRSVGYSSASEPT